MLVAYLFWTPEGGYVVIEFPCPICGYDGPHSLVESYPDREVLTCGDWDCGTEFEVEIERES